MQIILIQVSNTDRTIIFTAVKHLWNLSLPVDWSYDREKVLVYAGVLSGSQERFLVPARHCVSYIEKPIHWQLW